MLTGLADDAGVGEGPQVTAAPAEEGRHPAGGPPIAVRVPQIHQRSGVGARGSSWELRPVPWGARRRPRGPRQES